MSEIDVGKYLRLQGAIQSALDAVGEDQSVVGSTAMRTAYERLRGEVHSSIPDAQAEEFERLFPEKPPEPTTQQSRPFLAAARYMSARALLATLKGWLDGYIQEAQYEARMAEADAYARERVKAERGVGFRPKE